MNQSSALFGPEPYNSDDNYSDDSTVKDDGNNDKLTVDEYIKINMSIETDKSYLNSSEYLRYVLPSARIPFLEDFKENPMDSDGRVLNGKFKFHDLQCNILRNRNTGNYIIYIEIPKNHPIFLRDIYKHDFLRALELMSYDGYKDFPEVHGRPTNIKNLDGIRCVEYHFGQKGDYYPGVMKRDPDNSKVWTFAEVRTILRNSVIELEELTKKFDLFFVTRRKMKRDGMIAKLENLGFTCMNFTDVGINFFLKDIIILLYLICKGFIKIIYHHSIFFYRLYK